MATSRPPSARRASAEATCFTTAPATRPSMLGDTENGGVINPTLGRTPAGRWRQGGREGRGGLDQGRSGVAGRGKRTRAGLEPGGVGDHVHGGGPLGLWAGRDRAFSPPARPRLVPDLLSLSSWPAQRLGARRRPLCAGAGCSRAPRDAGSPPAKRPAPKGRPVGGWDGTGSLRRAASRDYSA